MLNKHVFLNPNFYSYIRIFLVPVLWVLSFFSFREVFLFVFLFSEFSDVLDGFVARLTDNVSNFGARLDTYADFLVNSSIVFWFGFFFPLFVKEWILLIIITLIIALIYVLISFIRFGVLPSYHLYSSKASVFMIFLFFIYSLLLEPNSHFFIFVFIVTSLSVLEMLLTTVYVDELKEDVGSLFYIV